MSTESMPRIIIWAGIATAVGGALFIAFAPTTLNTVLTPNTEQWNSALLVLNVFIQIARITLAPLGAALIAAGLVMKYIDRRLAGEQIADRPRRFRWPDDTHEDA